jgi:hypothetical protein
MILKDAEKEFDELTRTGFGIDGDHGVRDADFAAVRGAFADNSFVKALNAENEDVKKKAEAILESLAEG